MNKLIEDMILKHLLQLWIFGLGLHRVYFIYYHIQKWYVKIYFSFFYINIKKTKEFQLAKINKSKSNNKFQDTESPNKHREVYLMSYIYTCAYLLSFIYIHYIFVFVINFIQKNFKFFNLFIFSLQKWLIYIS